MCICFRRSEYNGVPDLRFHKVKSAWWVLKVLFLICSLWWELLSLGFWAVIRSRARTDKANALYPEKWQTSIAEQSLILETDLFQALVQAEFIPSHLQGRQAKNGMPHSDMWLLKVYNLCACSLLKGGNKRRGNNITFLCTCACQRVRMLIQI